MDVKEIKQIMEKDFKDIEKIKQAMTEKLNILEGFVKIKEVEQNPNFNEPWMPKDKDTFYYLNSILNVEYDEMRRCYIEQIKPFYIDKGNCFKTREQAEQRAKEIKVYNLLKNFSMANGGDEIDWNNKEQDKYSIYINFDKEENWEDNIRIYQANAQRYYFGEVYFISYEVAEEALRRYKKELEELAK